MNNDDQEVKKEWLPVENLHGDFDDDESADDQSAKPDRVPLGEPLPALSGVFKNLSSSPFGTRPPQPGAGGQSPQSGSASPFGTRPAQPGAGGQSPQSGSTSPFGTRPPQPSAGGQSPQSGSASPFGTRPPQPGAGGQSSQSGSASPFGTRPPQPGAGGQSSQSGSTSPFGSRPLGGIPAGRSGSKDSTEKEEVVAFGRGKNPPAENQSKGTPSYAFGNVFSSTQENKRNASSTFTVDALRKSLPLGHLSRHTPTPHDQRATVQVSKVVLGVCMVALSSGVLAVSWFMQDQIMGQWLASASQFLATWGNIILPVLGILLGFKLVLNSFGGE